jgi:uncharacterized protein YeaO (DUF488 family)
LIVTMKPAPSSRKIKPGAASRSKAAPKKKPGLFIKRVYDAPAPKDGLRFLVDRLWPRGIKKSALSFTAWMKEVAPSPLLRKWFGHQPARWTEFRRRYRHELENNPAAWKPLLPAIKKHNVTLLFAARERRINHAAVLKDFLTTKSR